MQVSTQGQTTSREPFVTSLYMQVTRTHLCVAREVRASCTSTSDGRGSDRCRHERRETKLHLDGTPREGRKASQNRVQTEAEVVSEGVEEDVRRPRCRQRIAGL